MCGDVRWELRFVERELVPKETRQEPKESALTHRDGSRSTNASGNTHARADDARPDRERRSDLVRYGTQPAVVSVGRVWTRRGVHGASLVRAKPLDLRDAVSESERHLARARGRNPCARSTDRHHAWTVRGRRVSFKTRSCALARASRPASRLDVRSVNVEKCFRGCALRVDAAFRETSLSSSRAASFDSRCRSVSSRPEAPLD